MLFGAPTEFKRKVLEDQGASAPAGESALAAGATAAEGDQDGSPPLPPPQAGHGRNGAQAYRDAPIVECEHPELQPGDPCPQCDTGKVYDSPPRTIVKVVGQALLAKAGAPLDNNLCERALKRSILHRKNSMFYKTPNGAAVGDIYMSLIHTCRLCDANPFEYLKVFQTHAQDVLANAALWLPWNYREQLTLVA